MKSQFTIAKKLFAVFAASLVFTLTVGGTAIWIISSLGSSISRVVSVDAETQHLAVRMDVNASEVKSTERAILARVLMKDLSAADQYDRDLQSDLADWKKNIDEFRTLADSIEERNELAEFEAGYNSVALAHKDFFHLASSGKADEAYIFFVQKELPILNRVSGVLRAVEQKEDETMDSVAKTTEERVSLGLWTAVAMLVLSILVAPVTAWIVRQITSSLRSIIGELAESAGQVTSAAGQISSFSQSLAQGASEQAASLEETSASSDEINSMARRNAENAHSAEQLVRQSQQKFAEMKGELETMVTAMSDIKESSDKVSQIIRVIDEIAFQTNILALNAAVEAARAGEAGMGFAVVADEVRNLAQRCAQAAKNTSQLIEESIDKSGHGKAKVEQVALTIRAIMMDSADVKRLVEQVSVGSEEQTRGIEQVAKALTDMEQVTQQSAANAEESAAAAEELTAEAQALMQVVHHLSAMAGVAEDARTSHRTPLSVRTTSGLAAANGAAVSGSARRPAQRDPFVLEPGFRSIV